MSKLTLGVIGTSKKEDERRVPIHPDHFSRIPEQIRRQLIFEEGYGAPFGIEDSEIASQTGGVATRHELLADLGKVIAAKPILPDLEELREGGILWGYVHCAQQRSITQAAIDRKQTLIAFEDMFVWGPSRQVGCSDRRWSAVRIESAPAGLPRVPCHPLGTPLPSCRLPGSNRHLLPFIPI